MALPSANFASCRKSGQSVCASALPRRHWNLERLERGELAADLAGALSDLHLFIEHQADEADDEDSPAGRAHDASERAHANQAIQDLSEIQAKLAASQSDISQDREMVLRLDRASREVDGVADATANYLNLVHVSTRATVHTVLFSMIGASAAILAAAATVGFSLYRGIIHPLRELSSGVREIAAGHFTKRLPERGDPEFLAVIHEFNQMAAQLEEFYLRLEEKVAEKSRELVRSERLASVGFLAAGVAHEINNPLNIISGYAELSLKMLGANGTGRSVSSKEARILGVIRDEAFRCKQITDKLLGLVQGGGEGREAVDMAQIVRDVTFLVRGLETFRERRAELDARVPDSLCAMVNPIELKQVVLNLTLNALDAVDVGSGKNRSRGAPAWRTHRATRARQRLRHEPRNDRACLRAVLHQQARTIGARHRPGPVDQPCNRFAIRRPASRRIRRAGTRELVHS